MLQVLQCRQSYLRADTERNRNKRKKWRGERGKDISERVKNSLLPGQSLKIFKKTKRLPKPVLLSGCAKTGGMEEKKGKSVSQWVKTYVKAYHVTILSSVVLSAWYYYITSSPVQTWLLVFC